MCSLFFLLCTFICFPIPSRYFFFLPSYFSFCCYSFLKKYLICREFFQFFPYQRWIQHHDFGSKSLHKPFGRFAFTNHTTFVACCLQLRLLLQLASVLCVEICWSFFSSTQKIICIVWTQLMFTKFTWNLKKKRAIRATKTRLQNTIHNTARKRQIQLVIGWKRATNDIEKANRSKYSTQYDFDGTHNPNSTPYLKRMKVDREHRNKIDLLAARTEERIDGGSIPISHIRFSRSHRVRTE